MLTTGTGLWPSAQERQGHAGADPEVLKNNLRTGAPLL